MVVERSQDSRVCLSLGVRKITTVVFLPWAMGDSFLKPAGRGFLE
jgi:hypothetical protein